MTLETRRRRRRRRRGARVGSQPLRAGRRPRCPRGRCVLIRASTCNTGGILWRTTRQVSNQQSARARARARMYRRSCTHRTQMEASSRASLANSRRFCTFSPSALCHPFCCHFLIQRVAPAQYESITCTEVLYCSSVLYSYCRLHEKRATHRR